VFELAEIVRCAGPAYRAAHGERLLPSHSRAMADLVACRTPALGGSLFACDRCDHLDFAYHSCRNRHCPKCHRQPTQRWLAKLQERLLPCEYYFATFTLPAELRSLARSNQRIVYGILMTAAAQALQLLADDPKWVGATLGILAVLHTWARDLAYHPHVHLLITAGGLTADGEVWRKPGRRTFLVPGYALSAIFRAKVRDALDRAGLLAGLDPNIFRKPWTVHLQHAGNGAHAGEYLSRYVYRVAITNDRIERFDGADVTFRYVSSRTHEAKRLRLSAPAFLARFLQHVLPKGFTKIRSYGLFSPTAAKRRHRARHLLELHRAATNRPPEQPEPLTIAPSPRVCPVCSQGRLVRRLTWRRPHDPCAGGLQSLARPPP
jgi:hypothetical protein